MVQFRIKTIGGEEFEVDVAETATFQAIIDEIKRRRGLLSDAFVRIISAGKEMGA